MKGSENPRVGIWSKYYFAIVFANFFVASCMNFHTAVTSLYVVSLGGTATYAGLLLTCFTFTGVFMRIVSGKMLDRNGRRKVITSGLVIYAAATALLTIPWLPQLPFSRALQAVGYSMASTGLTVAVTDVLPSNKMSEGIGYSGLVESLSSAVGPGFALWLYQAAGNYAAVYYFSVLMMAAAFILLLIFRYEDDEGFFDRKRQYEQTLDIVPDPPVSKKEQQSAKKRSIADLFERKAVPSLITSLFYSLAMSAKIAYLVLFAQNIGIANEGLFYTFEAISTVLARLLCGRIADRYGPNAVLLPGFFGMILAYILLFLSPGHLALFFISGVISGFGHGAILPTLHAQAVRGVPAQRRGAAVATYMVSFDIGIGFGGLIWGAIADRIGFAGIFLGCAACVALTFLLSLFFFSKKRIEERTSSA